jgi:dolichol kinase
LKAVAVMIMIIFTAGDVVAAIIGNAHNSEREALTNLFILA